MKVILLSLVDQIKPLINKKHIAKFLIVIGIALTIVNYGVNLISFYSNEEVAFIIDGTEENSEPVEKESSEKEDTKDKDKFFQYGTKAADDSDTVKTHQFSYNSLTNTSVYLEFATPPPEGSIV
ncbi:hypothetical protein [Aquimarina brevivitae]|uniref:Uncharacterized protein n=1 Tax=Aquimarina brevivitae TaxID=323412 RepID=A0A4Q7PFH6_9FLAO|nr:hypothetical protein [Aquimarina brevivitae]RZS99214.1 hypothetical protein EV197_0423 [Aquimarina brevivitae]